MIALGEAIGSAAVAAIENERRYQELCEAADAAGVPRPERIVVEYAPPNRKEVPWWSLALAILIGASL